MLSCTSLAHIAACEPERSDDAHATHSTDTTNEWIENPSPRYERAEFDGGLERDQIRSVVQSNIQEVRACYNAALAVNPTLAGTLTVRAKVEGSGQVATSAIDASDLGNSQLERCIADRFATWQFPPAASESSFEYPFLLEPG